MPELKPGTNRCECTECGEFFNSVWAFDKHIIFAGNPKDQDWNDRRCLSMREMKAKGWVKNDGGFWTTGRKPAAVTHSK